MRLPGGETLQTRPLRLTGAGAAVGLLAHVGLARVEDLPQDGLSGHVALVQRGRITFEEKVTRVAEAGAVAAIIYNNAPGPFSGRLREQADIPAVAIAKADGEKLLDLLTDGDLEVTVSLEMDSHASRNVVAERPSTSDDGRVLIIGAHYDTVPGTQGANDNGSGVATLMTLSAELADVPLPFRLRFLLFGSEEVGLFGSRHYVEALSQGELDSIIAMINIDSTGSGQTVVATGDSELAARMLDYSNSQGITVRIGAPLPWAGSDHASFRDAGAPVLFLSADDLSRINSPRDGIEFVRPELMGAATALVLGLIDQLAGDY